MKFPAGFGAAPLKSLGFRLTYSGHGRNYTAHSQRDTAETSVPCSCPTPLHPEGARHKEQGPTTHMLIANRQLCEVLVPNHG